MTKGKSFDDKVFEKNFNILKAQSEICDDASRKSSIDARIRDLIESINKSEYYFTTSSCSGRFLAFSQDETFVKKNCEWIKVTHEPLTPLEIQDLIKSVEDSLNENSRQITLKFEPFILHVCCRTLVDAKLLLEQCIASGFRNSGISLGSAKIILAVRSTLGLECPVADNGKLLVDKNYLEYICGLANKKFVENFERIDRFYANIAKNCLVRDSTANEKDVKEASEPKNFEHLKKEKKEKKVVEEIYEFDSMFE